jgi:hypothetical protein
MKTATMLYEMTGMNGRANLYRLSEALESWEGNKYEYVVVSAVDVPFSGPETYIFGADENGGITDWMELPGSFRGDLDHEEALKGAGYTVE